MMVIIDLEATTWPTKYQGKIGEREIIEIGAVKTVPRIVLQQESFQSYVKPVLIPNLDPFAIKLTGITQEYVNQAQTFKQVWEEFCHWISLDKNSIYSSPGQHIKVN